MGKLWDEDKMVLVQGLYGVLGPCPLRDARNGMVGYVAGKMGHSPESVHMRLRNYGAQDAGARRKHGRKFLSGEWERGDGKGSRNHFYLNMRVAFPGVFRAKLLKACRRFGIDPAIFGA